MVMVEIDPERLDQVARSLRATPEETDRAFRRALTHVQRRLRTRGAKALGLRSSKFVRSRVKTGTRGGNARVWFGLDPVLASGFIKPGDARRQTVTGDGVTVRGRRYPHGFFIKAGHRPLGEDKRDHLAVARRGKKIRPIRIDVANQARPILQNLSAEIPEMFEEEFIRQLEVANRRGSEVS